MMAAMPLLGGAEAVASIGAAMRLRLDGSEAAPELVARLDDVLDALGIREAVDELSPPEMAGLASLFEGYLAQATDLVATPRRVGWDHDQSSILMTQGNLSALLAGIFQRHVLPRLDGAADSLDKPGASFLDIGAGVAALSVAICRTWPNVRVTAVDPWDRALALARDVVAAADMGERIELRAIAAEQLDDEAEHDVAWVPTFFIPAAALDPIFERVHAALRPGGWVIAGLYARPADPLAAALADLRTVRQGGTLQTAQETVALLEGAGFEDVLVHFDAAWRAPVVFVAGRRAAGPG
jgi:SAM-dependent methyltransferase